MTSQKTTIDHVARSLQSAEGTPRRRRGVTLRAVVLGLLLIPLNVYWVLYAEMVWASIHGTVLSIFFNVACTFFVLAVLNRVIARFRLASALTGAEMLTVYIMLSAATALTSVDQLELLSVVIPFPYRFADAQNLWQTWFLGYLPSWLTVQDPTVLKGLYVGGSTFYRSQVIAAWLPPLAAWLCFMMGLLLTMVCVNVFLIRPWSDHERLSFPVIQLPMEMALRPSSLFGSKLFWFGFAVAGLLDLGNGLHMLFPSLPTLATRFSVDVSASGAPWNAIGWTPVNIYPFAIGLAYFMPVDLAFSVWFFYWFWKAQMVIRSAFGMGALPGAYMGDQSSGAWLGIGIIALWLTRRHLVAALKKALGKPGPDDTNEPLRYRTALIGIVVGLTIVLGFCYAAGMSLLVSVPYFALYLCYSLAATRMRAELGPPTHDLYFSGPTRVLTSLFGSRIFGVQNLVILTQFHGFDRDYRSSPMAHQIEALKMGRSTGMQGKRLISAMLLASLVAFIAWFWLYLSTAYQFGTTGKMRGGWVACGWETYNRLDSWLTGAGSPDWSAMGQLGFGLGFSLFLMVLRQLFLGFPFHPVGYAVCGSWTMSWLWFSVFIAWLIKLIILRYGGMNTFRRAIPLFVGLMLGEFVVGGGWGLYGAIAGRLTFEFFP